ncbi:hypothetical protein NBRC110019_08130 [Neptunitalea chrysea]|uniref:THUMP-like domain-containing protein n=1 Tax=Neptunitalea chrysea TaxID=1647581 RepID=A0A9W6B3H3_9FLAO|nr:class I SAM-dependent methyltransferase [Neptunitalea chrysea]GLB51774.1 hypothetical protein NBRC110019_08130 [Neptunitalea chrysea]
MNKAILNNKVQSFLSEHLTANVTSILLSKPLFGEVTNAELVDQIEAKKRTEKKLPLWFDTKGIYYPNKLNIEQTSSERTALYKASLVSGNSLIDITGGYGVDAYYFSRNITEVVHCEINEYLSDIVDYNRDLLNANNITCVKGDGVAYLENTITFFDWIYIDPSRRNDKKGKVFMLSDCLPDVPKHLELLFSKTNKILVKTSPVLDISKGLEELTNVLEIHIVAVNNEVKELLWILEKDFTGVPQLVTVNLTHTKREEFTFSLMAEQGAVSTFAEPQKYLYEPNAAILKSGAFKLMASHFKVNKLHMHSHLYTSNDLIDFPGRSFRIEEVIRFQKKVIKQRFQNTKANITARNFPDKPDVFKKQFKMKDGGEVYLFLTTDMNNKKIVIVASKV